MTTQPGEGGKQAASPNQTEIVHLISDHDNIGEARNWCGTESFNNTESFVETTCKGCLRTVMIYADGARIRLQHLEASK